MRKMWFILLISTLFSLLHAQTSPKAMIIFDASGSMWGQIDGKAKISIAKDTFKEVLSTIDPSIELGLTLYGHRFKGDCNDIETLIPISKGNAEAVTKAIMQIKPKGKTPISRTLTQVAEAMKYQEEKSTMILISDGKESCDPNPCATAKSLKEKGIDLVVHVVGFDVDQTTAKELSCIANATGGEYLTAKNASSLHQAMQTLTKKVEAPKPTPKPLPYNLEISASEKEGGKWVEAYHRIYAMVDGVKEKSLGSVKSKKRDTGTKTLPTGNYLLQSSYNQFTIETPFTIKPQEKTTLHIIMGQTGEVEVSASEKEGGKWVEAYHRIYAMVDGVKEKSLGSVKSKKKDAGTKTLPTGDYLLQSSYNQFTIETLFSIKPQEKTTLHIIMGQTGEVEVSASEKEGGKWVEAYHRIYSTIDGVKEKSLGSVKSKKKDAGTKTLPIGDYLLQSSYNQFTIETPFTIKPQEKTTLHILFGEFTLQSQCTSNSSKKITYEIYASTGQLLFDGKMACGESLALPLKEGSYTLEANYEEQSITKKIDTLESKSVTLEFSQNL
jgi:hypothetical protein